MDCNLQISKTDVWVVQITDVLQVTSKLTTVQCVVRHSAAQLSTAFTALCSISCGTAGTYWRMGSFNVGNDGSLKHSFLLKHLHLFIEAFFFPFRTKKIRLLSHLFNANSNFFIFIRYFYIYYELLYIFIFITNYEILKLFPTFDSADTSKLLFEVYLWPNSIK